MYVSLANMRAEANWWLSSRAAFTQCGHILRWRPCELATLLNVGICRGDLSEANETSEDKPTSNWSACFSFVAAKIIDGKSRRTQFPASKWISSEDSFWTCLRSSHPPQLFVQKCLNSLISADPKRNSSKFPSALSKPPHGIKPFRMSFRNQQRILISLEDIYKSLSDFNLRFSEHSCYNVVIKEYCRLNC